MDKITLHELCNNEKPKELQETIFRHLEGKIYIEGCHINEWTELGSRASQHVILAVAASLANSINDTKKLRNLFHQLENYSMNHCDLSFFLPRDRQTLVDIIYSEITQMARIIDHNE